MSKIIWHVTMSLDGFIAGRDDSMDWAFGTTHDSGVVDEVREGTGAILAGRRWYEVASRKYDGVAGIYGGAWTGPVFVITHRPDEVPDDPSVTFVSSDLGDAVGRAREAAGGRNVGIFGANTAQGCLEAGLLDELVIHVAPVLLGEGVRLYGPPGATTQVELARTDTSDPTRVADLRLRVVE